jgi:hypothetical protein
MSMEQFKRVEPLHIGGNEYAAISVAEHFVILGEDDEGHYKTLTVAEAIKLRDWLNSAIPTVPNPEGNAK